MAQAMSASTFKQRFVSNPKQVLEEDGFQIPAETKVEVITGEGQKVDLSGTTIYLTLAQPPTEQELNDAQLSSVAGGSSCLASASTLYCVIVCVSTQSTASTQC